MFGWDDCEACASTRRDCNERHAARVRELEAQVSELEARLRETKAAAVSAAETAVQALARLQDYEDVVRWARDWVKPPLSIIATRELCAAVERLEKRLAKVRS